MEIADVRLYTTKKQDIQTYIDEAETTVPPQTMPMSIFPEYRADDWRLGSGAYETFVVERDRHGATGFYVNESGGRDARRIIDRLYRRFIEGQCPFDVNRIWEQMYRVQFPVGQGGKNYFATRGVDIALYDLVGRSPTSRCTTSSAARSETRSPAT